MFLLHKLKLRQVNEPCILTGLTIRQAKHYSFTLDGTRISLKVPKHNTELLAEPVSPKTHYDIEGVHLKEMINTRDGWGALGSVFRSCDFYGPIFGGRLASMSTSVAIVTPRKIEDKVSFFHPRSFEYGVGQLLAFEHGDEHLIDRQAWLAPIEWQPLTQFESVAARFNVEPNSLRHTECRCLALPITNHHLLELKFVINWNVDYQNDNISKEEERNWLDRRNIYQLIDDVIDSLEVTLSDEARAQQAKALEGLNDTSLTTSYPPIDFSKMDGNEQSYQQLGQGVK
ncbi:MAG: hypothetical protein WCY88_09620 [Spongiibacteraceae bacterium]